MVDNSISYYYQSILRWGLRWGLRPPTALRRFAPLGVAPPYGASSLRSAFIGDEDGDEDGDGDVYRIEQSASGSVRK